MVAAASVDDNPRALEILTPSTRVRAEMQLFNLRNAKIRVVKSQ